MAQIIDLLTDHEMVTAKAVPNVTPFLTVSFVLDCKAIAWILINLEEQTG